MSSAKRAAMVAAAVVGVVGVVGVGGCRSDPVQAPYTGVPDQLSAKAYPNITVAGELSNFIAINQPTVEKTDVLTVVVPVRLLSTPGHESNIQYRFLFLKDNGTPARGGDMNWRFMHLAPRNQVLLTGNSIDGDAEDWRCEIRVAR